MFMIRRGKMALTSMDYLKRADVSHITTALWCKSQRKVKEKWSVQNLQPIPSLYPHPALHTKLTLIDMVFQFFFKKNHLNDSIALPFSLYAWMSTSGTNILTILLKCLTIPHLTPVSSNFFPETHTSRQCRFQIIYHF